MRDNKAFIILWVQLWLHLLTRVHDRTQTLRDLLQPNLNYLIIILRTMITRNRWILIVLIFLIIFNRLLKCLRNTMFLLLRGCGVLFIFEFIRLLDALTRLLVSLQISWPRQFQPFLTLQVILIRWLLRPCIGRRQKLALTMVAFNIDVSDSLVALLDLSQLLPTTIDVV